MSKITTGSVTGPVHCDSTDCGWQSQTHRFTARYSPKENCHGDGYHCQCAYEYAPQNFIPNTFNKTVSRVSHRKINGKPLLSLGVSGSKQGKAEVYSTHLLGACALRSGFHIASDLQYEVGVGGVQVDFCRFNTQFLYLHDSLC